MTIHMRKGSIYMEMLVVLPVLLFAILATIAIGQFLFTSYHISQAGQATMRQIVIDGHYSSAAQDILEGYLANTAVDPEDVLVQATLDPTDYGEPVELSLHYTYPLQLFGLNTTVPIPIHIELGGVSVYIPPDGGEP